MAKIVHVPVEKVRTEGLQARAAINQEVVREYAEASTTGGATLPPIIVFRDEMKNLWIGDGIHRLTAARSVGQKMLPADLRDGTRADALRFALGANSLHGMRRTAADKAHAVKMAYEHRAELGLPDVPAANLIAEIVGVSCNFASSQLCTVQSWATATARTGADGKTREVPPVPTRRPTAAAGTPGRTAGGEAAGLGCDGVTAGPAAPPYRRTTGVGPESTGVAEGMAGDGTDGDGVTAGPAAPPYRRAMGVAEGMAGNGTAGDGVTAGPAAPPYRRATELPPVPTRRTVAQAATPAGASAAGVLDERGRHIPAELLPVWHRRQEVQDAATAISRVRSALRAAQDGSDPLWSEINYSSVLNFLDRAYTEISSVKPWCVCPMCQGIGCRACKNLGLMGKYRFDNAIAPEFKR